MTDPPLVCVVILNWNRTDDTVGCVSSVLRSDYENFRVLVVDNGSGDDPTDAIRLLDSEVQIMRLGANLGYTGGNNFGIRHAMSIRADFVLIMNNDTLVSPRMITRLVEFAESRPGAGIVGPLLFCLDDRDRLFAAGSDIVWAKGVASHRESFQPYSGSLRLDSPKRVDFLSGCCLLVRKELIKVAGALDDTYFLNYDDVEWAVRAQRYGFQSWLVPDAHMWHKVSASLGQGSAVNTYYTTRNALRFFSKNGPNRTRPVALARIVSRTIRTIIAWSVKPEYRRNGYRRRRTANIYALRDFAKGRSGEMGADVARAIGVA